MRLSEIQALTPAAIEQLPTRDLQRLLRDVETVDVSRHPTAEERQEIYSVVRTTRQNLADALNSRSMSLCGGLVEPYLAIRSPEASET